MCFMVGFWAEKHYLHTRGGSPGVSRRNRCNLWAQDGFGEFYFLIVKLMNKRLGGFSGCLEKMPF